MVEGQSREVFQQLGLPYNSEISLLAERPDTLEQLAESDPIFARKIGLASRVSMRLAEVTNNQALLFGSMGFTAAVHGGIPYRVCGDLDFLIPFNAQYKVLEELNPYIWLDTPAFAVYPGWYCYRGALPLDFYQDSQIDREFCEIQVFFINKNRQGHFIDDPLFRGLGYFAAAEFRPHKANILGQPVNSVSPELAWKLKNLHVQKDPKGLFDLKYSQFLLQG